MTVNGTRSDVHGYAATSSLGQPSALGTPIHSCPVFGCNGCPPSICNHGLTPIIDNDQDGLESAVADAFTPLYSVSAYEPDQFATFGNYVPQTITSLVGTNPPFSYYRVQPLGLGTDANGTQLFALRVDYLTLWNADSGLPGSNSGCLYSYVGLDSIINAISGHELDAERSVMLLAAPAVNGQYNPDPKAYSLYTIYTAAHEGTFFDQSAYYSFFFPVPAGYHAQLALSLSKHSTYTFNPNGYPITPLYFITSYNTSLSTLYAEGLISDAEYFLSIAIGNNVFYGCLTEAWGPQQANYANPRINVGGPAHPINGSTFIQDDSSRALHLTDKLTNPVF